MRKNSQREWNRPHREGVEDREQVREESYDWYVRGVIPGYRVADSRGHHR